MATPAEPTGPLAGIRVIDLATEWAELTGRVLADLGAEVIKVEPPGGAGARRLPPFANGREEDPDGSLYWASVALGKRSVVLDLDRAPDRGRLLGLLQGADVLVESFAPGTLAALGLGFEQLHALNPRLIYVSVTPFGQTGPDACSPATELTIEAAGGLLGLQGEGDRPPVPVGYPQAAFHAAAQAAADAVIALVERDRSGLGQHLDVSAQTAIVWTLMNATGYPPNTGGDPPRTGERRTDPPLEVVPGLSLPPLWQCRDGYLLCTLALGVGGAGAFERLIRRADAAGFVDSSLRDIAWRTALLDAREGRLDVARVREGVVAIAKYLGGMTKQEALALACAEKLMLAPVNTVEDIVHDQQLAARDYWQQRSGRTAPGPFARLSRTPIRMGEDAPSLGEHQALLDAPPAERPSAQRGSGVRRRAFEGVKIADFAWAGVGPMTSKAFADHGATVVHVESTTALDILRAAPPYKDNIPGVDRTQFLANYNTSKLGLTLNLKSEGGRELARRLAGWADVVVESFTPGTMQRWGLDYATLSRDRPELVMLSTALRGQSGPQRMLSGVGTHGAALAGLHAITGWPDRPPCGPWGAYTDFIAPRYGVAALAAALHHRNLTGQGQYIDLSQVEAGVHFLEPLILDHTVNGRVAGPAGHDSDRACPHGIYRTRGTERYVAIAVETAAQWHSLRSLAPLDAFADGSFDALAARLASRDAISAAIERWACGQDCWELADRLKRAGVPASVVLRPTDLYADPQLTHRGFFVTLDHKVMGPTPYDGPVTLFSATPPRLSAAPCMGEHNHEVLTALLGLSPDEVATYAEAGALS